MCEVSFWLFTRQISFFPCYTRLLPHTGATSYWFGCCWSFFRSFKTQRRTSLDDCWRHKHTLYKGLSVWILRIPPQWTYFNDVQHTWRINQQQACHVIQLKLFTEMEVDLLKVHCVEKDSRAVSTPHSDELPQSCAGLHQLWCDFHCSNPFKISTSLCSSKVVYEDSFTGVAAGD